MPKINVLHLINSLADSSVSGIILRLMNNMDRKDIGRHLVGLNGEDPMEEEFARIGISALSIFSTDRC